MQHTKQDAVHISRTGIYHTPVSAAFLLLRHRAYPPLALCIKQRWVDGWPLAAAAISKDAAVQEVRLQWQIETEQGQE
jgi:hypothetical protein